MASSSGRSIAMPLLLVLGLPLLLVTAILWLGGPSEEGDAPSGSGPQLSDARMQAPDPAPGSGQGRLMPAAQETQMAPPGPGLPPSLRGTQIDGRLAVDAEGHLVLDRSVRLFFDYMLTGVGEMPLPELIGQIRRMIDQELQEPARGEAQRLLNDYLSYKAALHNLEQTADMDMTEGTPEQRLAALEQRQQAVMALRRETMGQAAAEAFFAEEELVDQFSLERLKTLARSDLSEDAKAERIAALEQALPEPLRRQRTEAVAHLRGMEQERQLLERGASDAELRGLREQLYGPEAAERLAQLDQQEREWKQRWQRYETERDRLLQAALDAQERSQALERLREQHFPPEDRRRVEVLDRLSGLED